MPMYNLIKCISNYSDTARTFLFHSKDEATNFNVNITETDAFKSFKCKGKLIGEIIAQLAPNAANGVADNAKIIVPWKHLWKVWWLLDILLINGQVGLKLKWIKHCVLSVLCTENDVGNSVNIIFTMKDTKLYVPAVTLSAKKQLETIKSS